MLPFRHQLSQHFDKQRVKTREEVYWLGIEALFSTSDILFLHQSSQAYRGIAELTSAYRYLQKVTRKVRAEEALGRLEARRLEAEAITKESRIVIKRRADRQMVSQPLTHISSLREVRKRHECYDRLLQQAQPHVR